MFVSDYTTLNQCDALGSQLSLAPPPPLLLLLFITQVTQPQARSLMGLTQRTFGTWWSRIFISWILRLWRCNHLGTDTTLLSVILWTGLSMAATAIS